MDWELTQRNLCSHDLEAGSPRSALTGLAPPWLVGGLFFP